jgi:plasmid stabilization system protein ParE
MKIIWSSLAIEQVAEIADYIAADKPISAKNWAIEIFDAVGALADFPELGRVIPEIRDSRFREIFKGHYRIIYQFENATVSILTIRHGKQILPVDQITNYQGYGV